MKPRFCIPLFVLILLIVFIAPVGAAAGAGAPASGASSADRVCDAYWSQKYDEALRLASEIVSSQESPVSDKVGAYKCQACTYVAQRKVDPARDCIKGMLRLDPAARFTPDYEYPPPVIDLYEAVRDSLSPGTMDINTVAIGDFEDNSPFKGKFKDYDFSTFRLALVHTVMADLGQATSLKIVDRQRTEQLVKEIQLGQSGFASPDQAVRFGQMLGAQSFIFGQYMILSKDTVRIDARVVHTATGEVILAKQVTGNFGGDPQKFLAMEKELVEAIAQGIGKIIEQSGQQTKLDEMTAAYFDHKKSGIGDRKGYVESKFMIAQALALEDNGQYKQAKTIWKRVLDIDPANEIAGRRVQALTVTEG